MSKLNVAISAAKAAGSLIAERIQTGKEVSYKSSHSDLVTEVDKQAEEIICAKIREAYPSHAILGEEGVAPGVKASSEATETHEKMDHLWVVDPIDGTTNFVHGFPFCCVSIAYAYQGMVTCAVIYDPLTDECFTAEKEQGAFLNGQALRVSEEKKLAESLIATGFPAADRIAAGINLSGINYLAPRCRNLRAAGSAALHLAYVAAGRISGFWELQLNAWDLAAGSLLVEEAGGKVTDTCGNPYALHVRHILATNDHIHSEMVEALATSASQKPEMK
ncbi:inositol monophosphatase family protein [Mechercharimyces sp. CAU 1602]|uniref:inositol monophosphatase family protein n=1 Tax=Mechercharimyces sp. CAU 1602 TaxID=2973933 RepID=UPI00216289BA|nr:inositol monophosphatase family protein [Mechercharimyces sp. CAU 1602]MCS1349996.1 inositol monophosphatase [Mechercharimyces sp. CAU 1602]